MYWTNNSKINRQARQTLENKLNSMLAKRDSINIDNKNSNNNINGLEKNV